jgi:hypothetical protein
MKLLTIAILFGMMTSGIWLMAANKATANADHPDVQLAQLYLLQAAFHRAASVHDTVHGDSAEEIDQRIRQILSLWAEEGELTLSAGSPLDGNYIGRGDPDDPSTCPTPSNNPANQGTLCTLYKYVAGSFQPQNKFISLSPSYKTHFQIDGETATVYFECHYFDVSIDPTTGDPSWTGVNHVALDGTARKIGGQWLLWQANAPKVGVPIP